MKEEKGNENGLSYVQIIFFMESSIMASSEQNVNRKTFRKVRTCIQFVFHMVAVFYGSGSGDIFGQ